MSRDSKTDIAPTLIKIAAIVSLSIGCMLAASIIMVQTWPVDNTMLLALRRSTDTHLTVGPAWLLDAMIDVTSLGSSAITGLVAAATALILLAKGAYRQAVFVALVFGGAELLGNGLKPLIGRARPDVVPHLVWVSGQSFPSGHATLSSALYLALGLLLASRQRSHTGRWSCVGIAILIASLVGFSRVFLGVHFPTDVIAGWSLGAGWSLLLWSISTNFQPLTSWKK